MTGILFTILTYNYDLQIHVLLRRVESERGMCGACCEGIQTPNALVPLTNATHFICTQHVQHPQTHTCFRVRGQVISPTRWSSWPSTSRQPRGYSSSECGYGTAFIRTHKLSLSCLHPMENSFTIYTVHVLMHVHKT